MQHPPDHKPPQRCLTITVPVAGRVLGLGRTAAYEAARKGEIPVLRIGHRLLVPIAELERMVGAPPGSLLTADRSKRPDQS